MHHIAARVPDDLYAEIQELQEVNGCSQSEAVRELLRRGTEYERLQRERDASQNQLNTLVGQREEHQELVEYVETERSLQERREQRQRERERAGILTRSKWWLFGRDVEDE